MQYCNPDEPRGIVIFKFPNVICNVEKVAVYILHKVVIYLSTNKNIKCFIHFLFTYVYSHSGGNAPLTHIKTDSEYAGRVIRPSWTGSVPVWVSWC